MHWAAILVWLQGPFLGHGAIWIEVRIRVRVRVLHGESRDPLVAPAPPGLIARVLRIQKRK